MFGLGLQELLVILVIALVIFGPSKLPQIGSGLGKAIRDFKKGVSSDDGEDSANDAKKDSPKDLPRYSSSHRLLRLRTSNRLSWLRSFQVRLDRRRCVRLTTVRA